MGKKLHDRTLSGASNVIDVDAWSKNKTMTRSTENLLTITDKTLSRSLLEMEQIFSRNNEKQLL